jgi:hypothetical protein
MVPNLTALRLDYLFPLRTGDDPSTSSLSASSMQQHQECFPAAQELQELCNSLAPTLQRLSLRGTALDDDGMLSLVQLNNLELLDLSKSSRAHAPLITDAGVRNLVSSRGGGVAASLLWLNLAMTRVTDEAVQSISTYMPRLRHLGLQCCSLLTDDCFEWLEGLGLHSLDVTSCPLLTNDAFFRLGSKRSLCRPILSVLLASYLPNCTGELLALFLAKFERLRVLEFKRKEALANEALLPPLDMRLEAKQRLAVAVFLHGDLDAIKLESLTFRMPIPNSFCVDVMDILHRHQIAKVSVVGHSFGSITSGWLVNRYPSVVSHLTLVDPVSLLLALPDVAFKFLYR